MVAFLSICAITVDLGLIYIERTSLKNAIDAATLAAAYKLPDTAAATECANEYIIKNGHSPDEVEILFEYDNTVIRINAEKQIKTSFARIFKVDFIKVSLTTCAKKESVPISEALGYLIYTGSKTTTLNLGGTFEIYGSIHSNGSLSVSPAYGYIKGAASSCNMFYVNPYTTTVGEKILNAPYRPMPDLTNQIDQIFPSYYEKVLNAADVNKISTMQYFTGNTKIIGNTTISNRAVVSGNLYVEGDLTINGGAPSCQLNGNIYATGKISFNNSFTGNGCVFAGGNITFNNDAMFDSDQPICLFSENGNISFSTSTAEIHGIVYAPNGSVGIQGSSLTFYGSIIANSISGMPRLLRMYLLDMELPIETVKTVSRLVE